MKKLLTAVLLIVTPFVLSAETVSPQEVSTAKSLTVDTASNMWSEPRPVTAPGLSNAYQLSPLLYRGAQPSKKGYRSLAERGVKAVISFRTKKPNTKYLNELGLVSYHIPINTFKFNNEHARAFLKILAEQPGPIYIHCYHGSDRTGTMTALYRIVYEKWPREKALAEMKDKKFGFHGMFSNLVEYIRTVKVEDIVPSKKDVAETGE